MTGTISSSRAPHPSRAPRPVDRAVELVVDRLVGSRVGARVEEAIDRRIERRVAQQVERRVAQHVERLRAELAEPPQVGTARIARDLSLDLLIGHGPSGDRLLAPDPYRRLCGELEALTGRRDVARALQQAYRSLLAQEMTGLGRIAGGTYNILGKLVAPPLLEPPDGPILEIGTLFGLFSPALVRQFRRVGQFRTLTVVDPLAGTQVQPGTRGGGDPSGTPVVRQVAERNLLESGLRPEELRLVEGLSTDDDVRALVGEQRYAVIVVDGDHSADGVHADLWWAETVAVPGAIVVMDDYGDGRWPGVETAVARYLGAGGALQMVGRAATSAYLRMPPGA